MAQALWRSDDPADYRLHLAHAESRTLSRCKAAAEKSKADSVRRKAHERFGELAGRFPEQTVLGLAELKLLRDWKMTRNKWRPSGKLVDGNDDARVRASTEKAFAVLVKKGAGGIKPAIEILATNSATKLKGIGPATATLLVALVRSDCPFFGERAALICLY